MMKTVLIKRLPAVLGITLILAIIIMAFFVATETNNGKSQPPADGNIGDGSLIDTTDPEDVTPPRDPYVKTLPKLAAESETYLYQQYIEGDGDITFQALHQTSDGLFAVVESDCTKGDIEHFKKTVGVVHFNVVGTLLNDFTFAGSEISYVASQITALGLVVVTASADGAYYYVNIVDWDLDGVTTIPISGAKSASVYPTASSFILTVEYDNDCVFYLYQSNEKFSVRSMGRPFKIVSLFEYGNHYLIFANYNTSYYAMKIQKVGFQTLEEHITSNATLIDAVPIMENGTQKFILLENGTNLNARKITLDFDESKTVSQRLGNIKIACAVPAENYILIVTSGNLNGMLRLGYDLSGEYTDSTISAYVKSIEDRVSIGNNYYFLSIDSTHRLSLITFSGNTTSVVYLKEGVRTARFSYNLNGTFSVLYQTEKDGSQAVGIIGYSK